MSAMSEVDAAVKALGWDVHTMRSEDLAEVYAMARIAGSTQWTYEACDHLADHGVEALGEGRTTWNADGWTVAHLVHAHYPGEAMGFFDHMAEYVPEADAWRGAWGELR